MLEMNLLMIRSHQSLASRSAPDSVTPAQPVGRSGLTAGEIERLIERSQCGDKKAFGELYQHHLQPVYSYIWLQVRDDAVAEDLVQDVFMGLLRGLATFRLGQAFAPWLMRVAHNRVVNHWRAQGRQPQIVRLPEEDDSEEVLAPLAAPESMDEFVLDISLPDLADALNRLTELQREVILLRFGAELSLAETASVVGRTVNAVKNIEFKGLLALRRQLIALEACA
jgi:RNA polymerase sigma-70 factor (ECF subfamily)